MEEITYAIKETQMKAIVLALYEIVHTMVEYDDDHIVMLKDAYNQKEQKAKYIMKILNEECGGLFDKIIMEDSF